MTAHRGEQDFGDASVTRAAMSTLCVLTGHEAGATATIAAGTIPADAKLLGVHLEGNAAITFTGTTTGVSGVVGIAGTTNGFLTTAAFGTLAAGALSDLGGPGTLLNRVRTSATSVILTVTATGGATDVAEIATGSVWVHVEYELPKQIRA